VCTIINIYYSAKYPNPPFEKSKETQGVGVLLKPFRDRPFLMACLFLAGWILLQNMAVPLFTYVMLDILDISIQWVSVITTIQMVVMMASYYIWGNLNSRYNTRALLFWTLPFIAGACLLWGAISVIPAIVVLMIIHVLLGFGTGGFNQLVFNFLIQDAPKSERPMYIAVYSGLTGITGFLGPIMGGIIYKQFRDLPDWTQQYGVSTALGVILTVLCVTIGAKIFIPEVKFSRWRRRKSYM
jgi:MFS family permease